MSIQNNKLPDNPNIEVIKAKETGLFTNYIFKAIPLAFDESMSYYETLCGLLNYLKNTILPTLNNNADAAAELQALYIELKTYVDNYFTNLDVQEEINNKLDEMAQDGTLTQLIKNYVDPVINNFKEDINTQIKDQNSEINNFKENINTQIKGQNSEIAAIEAKVDGVASGSPAGVYESVEALTTADPDHNKTYVVSNNGHWYYYNNGWKDGGVYQASVDTLSTEKNSEAISNIDEELNSIRKNVVTKFSDNTTSLIPIKINRKELELFQVNKVIRADGTIADNTDIDIYKYTIKDDDIYIGLKLLPKGIGVPGSVSYMNDEGVLTYKDLNGFIDYDSYRLGVNGFKYIDLYLNYDKKNNLGVDYITIYRHIGINPSEINKIMLDPYNNVISVGQIIDSNTINNIELPYYITKVNIDENYDYYKNEYNNYTVMEGCCYDSNDKYLGNIIIDTSGSSNPRIVHLKFYNNTSYIKLNITQGESLYCIKKEKVKENTKKLFSTCVNKPYNFNNKKISFFGDSITWLGVDDNTSYANYFSDLNGNTFKNYGISGYCMAERTDATNTIPSVLKSKDLSNSDYIFIAGGVNDYGWNVPLGTPTDTEKNTFYGALNDLASYLKENYPTKEIIFILPIINNRELTWDNKPLLHKLNDYRAIIYNVCIKNEFSVVNGLDFAFPDKESSIYTDLIYDDTHPTILGRKIYAKSLSDILN